MCIDTNFPPLTRHVALSCVRAKECDDSDSREEGRDVRKETHLRLAHFESLIRKDRFSIQVQRGADRYGRGEERQSVFSSVQGAKTAR